MQIKLVNPNYTENYLENLLHFRGVEDIDEFLNPTKELLSKPNLLKNMSTAATAYKIALDTGRPIALIADSDCDGYTSAAIFYTYTKQLYPNTEIDYFLHTKKQHGLEDMWEKIIESDKNYCLVVCPDSSSNDYEYHEKIYKEKGCCTLVLDHHELDIDISDAALVVNNQISPNYKNKELTGAGVAWQFCRYLDEINNTKYADDLIDLAALGICGDMGSVLELENRYIMKTGFNNIKNKFFKALAEKQDYSMGGVVNPTTVAFYIVPLINAMIRVGTQEEKERMFLAFIDGDRLVPCNKRGAKGTMERVCIESARECTNARSRQNKLLETNTDKLEMRVHKLGLLENKILVVPLEDEDDFPSELNGLIAMRLSAKFKKPTIIVRLNSEGYLRGSIRGLSNSPLPDFKQFLIDSSLFEYVAGHPNAAGCSFLEKDLSALNTYANRELESVDFGESYFDVNFIRSAADEDISDLILNIGRCPELWGQKNIEPLIYIKDINITKNDIKIMGKKLDTVKITKFNIPYIKFHAKDFIKELEQYDNIKLEIVGKVNINTWCGITTGQIFIENYEVSNGFLGF